MAFPWTPEATEMLESLLGKGMTASTIAKALGEKFGEGPTRNAVIGKIHRTKGGGQLSQSGIYGSPGIPHKERKERVKKTPARPQRVAALMDVVEALHGETLAALADVPQEVAIPVSGRVTLMDLTIRSCRWPMGDPLSEDFRFCGRLEADMARDPARPYCDAHARIVYQPALKPYRRSSSDKHTAWLGRTC